MKVSGPLGVTHYEYDYDWFDQLASVSIGINDVAPSLVRTYEVDEGDSSDRLRAVGIGRQQQAEKDGHRHR